MRLGRKEGRHVDLSHRRSAFTQLACNVVNALFSLTISIVFRKLLKQIFLQSVLYRISNLSNPRVIP